MRAVAAPVLPSVSVVVCAYTEDRFALLLRALDSVAGQDPAPAETIVVIDHNPELLDAVRAARPDLVVIASHGPPGLSGARNTGLDAATGDVVAFLDDDAAAEPGWLAALAAPYADPDVLAVGGWATPDWEAGRPAWFPQEFDWVVGCSYRGLPKGDAEVRNMLGCNMSFRRAALERLGGFDPRLGRMKDHPIGAEETELCIRLRQSNPGGRILQRPAARVRHHVPAGRGTWEYFRARCRAEGWSKAILSRLVGTEDGLASERRHVLVTLPRGVLRGVADTLRGDTGGVRRAGAILAGTAATGIGYLTGLRAAPFASPAPTAPAPVGPRDGGVDLDREPAA